MKGNLSITGAPIDIKDEGTSQGFATVIDFVGAGVSTTVSGNTATVTIAASTDQATVLKLISFRA